jgi:hypothetical protein
MISMFRKFSVASDLGPGMGQPAMHASISRKMAVQEKAANPAGGRIPGVAPAPQYFV